MIRKIIHSPQALIGLAMMLIVFLVMVFAPFLAPNDPMQLNVAHSFAPPDTQYPLGTDELGRCVLSRLIYGARESLSIALPTLLLLAIISTVIATLCAYLGGIVDRVFEVVSNIFMAFPPFLVAITLVPRLYSLPKKNGISFVPCSLTRKQKAKWQKAWAFPSRPSTSGKTGYSKS